MKHVSDTKKINIMKNNYQVMIFNCLLFSLFFNKILNLAVDSGEIIIPVTVYISQTSRDIYARKMEAIDDAIEGVRVGLERKLNDRTIAEAINTRPKIVFDITIIPESPPGIDLDTCGQSLEQITSELQMVYTAKNNTNTILVYSCPSDDYADYFARAHLNSPVIIHTNNLSCVKSVATFTEPEQAKFKLTFANAFMAAAGANSINPVSIKEDDGGDYGVKISYFINDEAYNKMLEERCRL